MMARSLALACLAAALWAPGACAQPPAPPRFKAIAFYTGQDDKAHISFVNEAKSWFARMAQERHFDFEATSDWTRLENDALASYPVVIFLDTRPESPRQREAFRRYMEHGGGWMGFHFAAFALSPSKYPQNWPWYHDQFLGSGQYISNTWRPTSAVLKVETATHPATAGMPATFKSTPNEWYRWANDLRANPDIQILASIDPSSFPLGTGPKPHEIWHEGDYPVVWTNRKYRMIYFNFGHNDLDYDHGTNRDLSSSFSSPAQNQLILQALEWLGAGK